MALQCVAVCCSMLQCVAVCRSPSALSRALDGKKYQEQLCGLLLPRLVGGFSMNLRIIQQSSPIVVVLGCMYCEVSFAKKSFAKET